MTYDPYGQPLEGDPGDEARPAGRELAGVMIDNSATIQLCRSCGMPIWWGLTAKGRSNPFDVVGGVRTVITHFSTCPHARTWTKR